MYASIFGLDLAAGIKDMLLSTGLSIDILAKMPPAELAVILGIDFYIARLIYQAAKRHKQVHDIQLEINEEEIVYAAKKDKA